MISLNDLFILTLTSLEYYSNAIKRKYFLSIVDYNFYQNIYCDTTIKAVHFLFDKLITRLLIILKVIQY